MTHIAYNRNHDCGLGPIPKPKHKLADLLANTFSWYFGPILWVETVTNIETTFQRENLDTNIVGVFSIIKGPLKTNLLSNIKYFLIIFVDLCSILSFSKFISPHKVGKHKKNKTKTKNKSEEKKSVLIPIPKLDLHFGSQYWNLILVVC